MAQIEEKSLERMEALLTHSASGVHALFENQMIAGALRNVSDDKDFFDFDKMKKVQDVMTALITKRGYIEKVAFLKTLDSESLNMLIRAYFHIVESTVRANSDHTH